MAKPPSSTAKNRKPAIAADHAPDPAAEPPVAFDAEGLKRVQDIIKNARATWFALLGALVFASITLASVKDVSFFVNTVETKLPLVGISVPVTSFFWAGSLLIAAIYAYFHLYLELLWQALGDAPARIDGKPLADRIDPWIVADSALRLRDRLRGAHREERASRKRAMQVVSDVVSVGLVWVFGLVVIFWFWWRSMPKHDPWLTGFLGLLLTGTFWVFCASLSAVLGHLADGRWIVRWKPVFALSFLLIGALTTTRTWIDPWAGMPRNFLYDDFDNMNFDYFRRPEILRPARANLSEVVFTEKPKDWQGKIIAETEFRMRWCAERIDLKCANPLDINNRRFNKVEEKVFQAAWQERWAALLATFSKPDLRGKDFRGADMSRSSLEGANLNYAMLEGVDLSLASLDSAVLDGATINGGSLYSVDLRGASLFYADLKGVHMDQASLESSDFNRANLEAASLTLSNLQDADLSGVSLKGANLKGADLTGANLNGADLEGSVIKDATFNGANLETTKLFGETLKAITMRDPNSDATFDYSALRSAKLDDQDLARLRGVNSTFGDASVTLPAGFFRPCQWGREDEGPLSDVQYFGRWRGWIEDQGGFTFDDDFENHPSIPPPAECRKRRFEKD
jgi:uncharacterized protein YjbI with pentapeptide repeats